MPRISIKVSGTTITGPGKTRQLGAADTVTYHYDAAGKKYASQQRHRRRGVQYRAGRQKTGWASPAMPIPSLHPPRQNAVLQSAVLPVAERSMSPQTPVFDPSRTALLVMHYQTDIMELFPSVAPPCSPIPDSCATRARGSGGLLRQDPFQPRLPGSQPLEQERAGHQAAGPVRARPHLARAGAARRRTADHRPPRQRVLRHRSASAAVGARHRHADPGRRRVHRRHAVHHRARQRRGLPAV